jgi:unsaturated pyranuronate lyase
LSSYSLPSIWHDKPEAWHEVMPGVRRRMLNHAATGMMVYYKIEPGRVFAWHNHPHAQFGFFLEGGGVFKIGETEWEMKQGDGYFIPPGVFHELRTTGDKPSVIIDFFTPERAEYISESLEPDKKS